MKTAYVIAASDGGYVVGLAATLNNLDYHHNKTELHWIHSGDETGAPDPLTRSLIEALGDNSGGLGFDVHTIPMNDLIEKWPESKDRRKGWLYRFCKYKYIQSLASEYDAVAVLCGDGLVVNFIDPYLGLVAGTKYMLTANHSWAGRGHILGLTESTAASRTIVTDIPLMICPRYWTDVIDTMWEFALATQKGCTELHSLNYSVWKHQRGRDCVMLAEAQWVSHHLWFWNIEKMQFPVPGNDEPYHIFVVDDGARFHLNHIHCKWWSYHNCDSQMGKGNETFDHNVKIVHNEYFRALTEGTIKLDFTKHPRIEEQIQPYG